MVEINPAIRNVRSGTFGPSPEPNWDAIIKLIEGINARNNAAGIASGPVGGGVALPALHKPLTESDFNGILLEDVLEGKKGRAALTGTDLLKPEVLGFLDQLENQRREYNKQIKPQPGAFDRVIDVLSRPTYMGVNLVGELIDPKFSKASNPLSAAGKGLWGTEKNTFTKVLDTLGWEATDSKLNNILRGATSFVGDVLLDPTTYLFGVGAAKNVGSRAAIKAGEVAGIAGRLQTAGTAWSNINKIGKAVPGPKVAGLLTKDEGYDEFISRYASKLRGDNPYMTRREKLQLRDVAGIKLPNAVGREAEEAAVRNIMRAEGIPDRTYVDILGDPAHDLAAARQDPWIDFYYSKNPTFWDNLRAQHYDPVGLGGPQPNQRMFGLPAARAEINELETKLAGDAIHPILDEIDALPEMRQYFARVGIPFTRAQKKFDLSKIGMERETGKFIRRMQDVKQGARIGLPGEKVIANMWNRWDQAFNTAMKHNPSIAGVKTDFYTALSVGLKAVSDRLNHTFEGLDRVQRKEVMDAILSNDLSKVSHITNKSGTAINDAVLERFDDIAKQINNTIEEFGGDYKAVGPSMLSNIPTKYRVTESTWENWIDAMGLSHRAGRLMTGQDLVDFLGHQYRTTTRAGATRVPLSLSKNLDPAEAMYFLSQGVMDYVNRRGFVEGIRAMGVTPIRGNAKLGKPNNAAVQMLQGLPKGTMREITGADQLMRKGRIDKHINNVIESLKGTQFSEDVIPHIIKTLEMTSPKQYGRVIEGYVNAMQHWKRLNTIWRVPSYHLRNTYSDLALNHMNGLAPNSIFRPGSAYGKAIKVLRAVAPNDTLREMMDEMYMHFNPGEYPNILAKTREISQQVAAKAGLTPEQEAKLMKPLITKGGESLNALDIYGLYRQHGLESHFHSEDLAKINMKRGQTGREGPLETLRQPFKGRVSEKVYLYSSMRENYFRVSNFIHSLERELADGSDLSRAAQKAAEDVRKFNFDYSDVTDLERRISNMAMPFYKWSRKSIPLLLTSLFQNPRIFALWNHFQDAIQTAAGEQEINRTGVLPDFADRVPTYMLEGGGFKLGSKNGDPIIGTGLPNMWRESLAFLTGVPYRGGARDQANTALTATKNQLLQMLGPFYSAAGIGPAPPGMPDTSNLFSETLPGQRGNDPTKFIASIVGGPAALARTLADSAAYNATQEDYPGGVPIDPVLLRYLTGSHMQQLTAPRQMSAINNIYDMIRELNKAEEYTQGGRTTTERRREDQSWNQATQTSSWEALLKALGVG